MAHPSWGIHYMKMLIGSEEIRQSYINTKFKFSNRGVEYHIYRKVQNGFNLKSLTTTIKKYKQSVSTNNNCIAFTVTNNPGDGVNKETHFQTFIITRSGDSIVCIAMDPARKARCKGGDTQGMYWAQAANEINTICKNLGIKFGYLPSVIRPCQMKYGSINGNENGIADVFCQTWSLYLLHHTLEFVLSNVNLNIKSIPYPNTGNTLCIRMNTIASIWIDVLKTVPDKIIQNVWKYLPENNRGEKPPKISGENITKYITNYKNESQYQVSKKFQSPKGGGKNTRKSNPGTRRYTPYRTPRHIMS